MYNETVLGLSIRDKIFIILFFPILGTALGWFLPAIADWLIKVPFMPLKGPLEWIASNDNPWIPIVTASILGLLGIALVVYIFYEVLHITLSEHEIRLTAKNKTKTIAKQDITAVFLEGKHLILLGHAGHELYRGQPEAKKAVVKETFEQYGYPWTDKDPYEDKYERWVPEHPNFSSSANALLAARERALKNDEPEEAESLRKDLVKIGIIVRDEKKRQYVRKVEEPLST